MAVSKSIAFIAAGQNLLACVKQGGRAYGGGGGEGGVGGAARRGVLLPCPGVRWLPCKVAHHRLALLLLV